MSRLIKFAFRLGLALKTFAIAHPAFAATVEERIAARLDALEKENAALRARVKRLEASKAARMQARPATLEFNPALVSRPPRQNADSLAADAGGLNDPEMERATR